MRPQNLRCCQQANLYFHRRQPWKYAQEIYHSVTSNHLSGFTGDAALSTTVEACRDEASYLTSP